MAMPEEIKACSSGLPRMLLYTIVLDFGFPAYHWSCSTTWFKVSSGGFNNREPAHNLQQPPHTAEPATVHSKRGQPNPLFGHRANGPEALEPSTQEHANL